MGAHLVDTARLMRIDLWPGSGRMLGRQDLQQGSPTIAETLSRRVDH